MRRQPRVVALCVLALLACRSLPPDIRPEEQVALSPSPAGPLADVEGSFRARAGPDRSGFLLLDQNAEALRWRLALADLAVRSLDLQYYLWYSDDAGRILMEAVLRAADRGVRVRILVDDLIYFGKDRQLQAIDSHPNVVIHLANPWTVREGGAGARMVEYIGTSRLNHRMHNKLMVADGRIAIVGGRNIGAEYFGLNPHSNFHDLDILAVGPVVRELGASFDGYWNSELAVPVEALPADRGLHLLEAERERTRQLLARSHRIDAFPRERADWSELLGDLPGRLHPGTARVVADAPALKEQEFGESIRKLTEIMAAADEEILVENAYWVPDDETIDALAEFERRGVRMRVLTNSLASHDVPAVNGAYKKWRRKLVEAGVELYELRHDAALRELQDTPPTRSSFLGLHTKAFSIDDEIVYVGSHNLDPRSDNINTELGLVVTSPELAASWKALFERDVSPENAWRVRLDDEGELVWEAGDLRERSQPARSGWQRVQDFFFGLLPIEDQL